MESPRSGPASVAPYARAKLQKAAAGANSASCAATSLSVCGSTGSICVLALDQRSLHDSNDSLAHVVQSDSVDVDPVQLASCFRQAQILV